MVGGGRVGFVATPFDGDIFPVFVSLFAGVIRAAYRYLAHPAAICVVSVAFSFTFRCFPVGCGVVGRTLFPTRGILS